MGQTSSTEELDAKETVKYQEFVKNYQFLRKIKDPRYGEISILQDKYTKELVALREMLSKSAKDFEKDIISLRARYKISHPNLVKVLGYTSKSEDNFCASIHKILMIVEYLDNDLEKEITLKKNQNNYYKEDQLWYLIENVVKALSVLQKNDITHEDIKPSSIFISKMGVYKIAQHNIAGSTMPAYHQRMTGLNEGRTYLSPALLLNLQNNELRPQHNAWKSDVFSLGMSILHAATLTNCEKLYNWNNFSLDLEELGDKLSSLRSRYSERFQDFVQSMLELRENIRPDFTALEAKLSRASDTGERLNPTPGTSPLQPRVNEYQQDIPDDGHEDFHRDRYANQQKPKMARAIPDTQENGPYLQRNVTNPIFTEGRIAPLKSEENALPYSSAESVGQSKRSLAVDLKPLEPRAPQYWENTRTNEPSLYNLQNKEPVSTDYYNRAYNIQNQQMAPKENFTKPFEHQGYQLNIDKGYNLPTRNEPSEFLVSNRPIQKVDAPQPVQYQAPKFEQKPQIISLNDIQNQAPGNSVKLFEPNENLRKSLISDEVAKIMSDFRSKIGMQIGNTSMDAPYDNYNQKENIKAEDHYRYSADIYNQSKYPPTENLALTSNPAVNAVFHASTDYTALSQQPLKASNRSLNEEKPFQSGILYDVNKEYAYGDYFSKIDNKPLSDVAPNLPNRPSYEPLPLPAIETTPRVVDLTYAATIQQPSAVQNTYEIQTQHHAKEDVKKSVLPQTVTSRYEYNQTSYQAPKHDIPSQSWEQAYASQTRPQVEQHKDISNYYSNGQNIEQIVQESQGHAKGLPNQSHTTYDSIPQHSYRNEINSFEPYVRTDYAQLSQVGFGEQRDKQYNQQNANPYNLNYSANQNQHQNLENPYAVQEKHQEVNYNYEPRQQDNLANAYSSVGSTQNRLSPQGPNEEEIVNETYPDGSVYEGQKFNGLRHGKGTFYYSDGGVYTGDWVEGSMEGYGELFYAGGAKAYEGEWKEDKFHGRGAVYNEMPAQLVGEYDLTNFDVVGDFWVSYEGDFYNDNKDGNGVLLLSNGERFEGEFKEDMVDGVGTFYTVDGRAIRGEWWQNKLMKTLQ